MNVTHEHTYNTVPGVQRTLGTRLGFGLPPRRSPLGVEPSKIDPVMTKTKNWSFCYFIRQKILSPLPFPNIITTPCSATHTISVRPGQIRESAPPGNTIYDSSVVKVLSFIVEKDGAALREMRLAIQAWMSAWIAPSLHHLFIACCARTVLFCARALFIYLFIYITDVYV